MSDVLGSLIQGYMLEKSEEVVDFGKQIGRLYTDHGLPIDMALDRLPKNVTKDQKVLILSGVGEWLLEHKRNSGGTEKSIERQRDQNKKMIADFLQNGETGLY